MAESIYKKKQREKLEKIALLLYRQGLSTRKVGEVIGKSHQWVANVVKKLDKNLQKKV